MTEPYYKNDDVVSIIYYGAVTVGRIVQIDPNEDHSNFTYTIKSGPIDIKGLKEHELKLCDEPAKIKRILQQYEN